MHKISWNIAWLWEKFSKEHVSPAYGFRVQVDSRTPELLL